MINELIKLTQQLINQPSITPNDCACQQIIAQYLKKINFSIEYMNHNDTRNLWAYHTGFKNQTSEHYNTLLFLGHTDVVSPGNIKNWDFPPFSGKIKNNILYGRGSADMKGAIAAMLIAAKCFIKEYPQYPGRIAFLLTSDEEGSGSNGIVQAVNSLLQRNEHIEYCIIGEPSSEYKLGDVIKNGRRGSYNGQLTIYGSQGHVAYPQFLTNPIHLSASILLKLLHTTWDTKNSTLFPPTSIQITNIYTDITKNSTNNITPNKLILKFNLRFNDQSSIYTIQNNIKNILSIHNLRYHLDSESTSEPYFSIPGKLANITINTIRDYQKIIPKLKTTGGTSDGRFITKMRSEIIELGALNQTIHKINECINLTDLKLLSNIYLTILKKIFFIN